MATIKLYGAFRRHVTDWRQQIDAATVGEALRLLTADNPPLREGIFAGEGLRPHVRVVINGRDAALLGCLDTPLTPTDEVSVFSPIGGG
jgi:molybdopterin converting factor small subunit